MYHRLCVNILTLILGGRLNGRCYFSVKKSSHREKTFQCVSSRLDAIDLGPSLDLDANGHQSLFGFKLMQSWSENRSETS